LNHGAQVLTGGRTAWRVTVPPLWLGAAAVAAAWVAGFALVGWLVLFVHQPVHKDFRVFYVAAEAGLRYGWASIYDLSTLRSLSAAFPPGQTTIDSATVFVNPPLLAWLVAPLTAFPVAAAYAIWTAFSLGAMVWSWRIAAPFTGVAKVALLLAALALWPVSDDLYYGQPCLLVIGLVATAWWFCTKDRPLIAGVALALATALKPQDVILVPFALLASGRVRPFLGWAAGCAFFGAAFAAVLGVAGLERWWRALMYLQSDPTHTYFTLAYVLGTGPVTYVVEGIEAALAIVIAWQRRTRLEVVFAAGIVGSIASSFHLHEPDYAVLVLAAWLILRSAPPRAQLAWLAAGILSMEAVSLARPLPQLIWDAVWLVMVAISSFAGSDESAPATRRAVVSAGHEDT
jgi:Glycosyltransferase family 87